MAEQEDSGPSAASKAQDQQLVALDELSVEDCQLLEQCAEFAHSTFQNQVNDKFANTKLWSRLVETAKRKKLSPLAYAEQFLIDRK